MDSEKPASAGSPTSRRLAETATDYTDTETDRALSEIRRWERAARLVADDPALTLKRKCFGLLEMMACARRSELAGFLETAVWRGSRHLFDEGPRDTADVIDATRRLRRQGHHACPTCRRPLPDHDELDYWRELQHDLRRPA
jgi:hypothetical protein